MQLPPFDSTDEKILPTTPHPRGAEHPFLGRLSLTRAAYRQAHWLGHSNGAAGAFLRHIGLMGLIGQRLTEWQALFNFFFRGAAPALRFTK